MPHAPDAPPPLAARRWRDARRILAYVLVLLALVLPAALLAAVCLLALIVEGQDPSARPVALAVAAGLAALVVAALLLLNRRLPIRALAPAWGGVLASIGWSIPALLLAWALGLGAAAALGVSIEAPADAEATHREDWDWD